LEKNNQIKVEQPFSGKFRPSGIGCGERKEISRELILGLGKR